MNTKNANIDVTISNKDNIERMKCKSISLKTDNHEYSIFEHHANIALPLKNAVVTLETENNQDTCIKIDSGIFIFQNNSATIIQAS